MRLAARVAAILLLLAVCYPLHRLHHLLFRTTSPWPRRFLGAVGRVAGLRVRVEGAPLPGPLLLVANHVSWLDILALGGATGCRFVSKREVQDWPVLGRLAGIGRTVFVDRTARRAVAGQAASLIAALGEQVPVVLFAEGTTGDGVTLRPFRAPLFAAAAPSGARVQPVALRYRDPAAVLWPEGEGAGRNARLLLARRGRIDLTIRFLPPVEDGPDRKAIAAAVHASIARALAG